jgi:DNA-binding GntR family transcriptional regulator
VLEFSRLQEINTMRVFVELLRERVGSPLSLASLARDLAVSPTTLRRYLDILAALYVVIVVKGDGSVRFENAVAVLLQHRMHQLADTTPHRALLRFAGQFPEATASQIVRDARQREQRGAVAVVPAGAWLVGLLEEGHYAFNGEAERS